MFEVKRDRVEKVTQTANARSERAVEREAEFRRGKQAMLNADAAKTARLRSLRLAKDAADKEVKLQQEAEKLAAPKARRAAAKPSKS
jgi:hypothetical protein